MTKQKKATHSKTTNDTVRSKMKVTVLKGKAGLHKRNLHHGRYNFNQLVNATPELKQYVVKNPKGEASINFSDPQAVKLLNKALLAHHYGVISWDIPKGYLCPPIPGRADYIHRLAELLSKDGKQVKHESVNAFDVGVGANCIYPIVGATQYGWNYVGSDIDPVSVKNSNQIVEENPVLKGHVECRLQTQSRYFFKGVIKENEYFDVTTCNPPFHKSMQEAQLGTERKLKNLNRSKQQRGQASEKGKVKASPILNFGGQNAELWCPGGEAAFIKNLAFESRDFAHQVLWFSTLISKKENVRWMRKNLEKAGAKEVQVVEMSQGQKVSRFIAWTFKTATERQAWYNAKV
ncbi:23S rRNA (adenine(1618)-N(6))-methyltransferase RlmF [Vibrio coralliilyticus]|uniref:Ribosomal RNA large subunit methyltransferase F n=1 Tax=Vibrio coralliilyticus TaxID=190893 RepID=A0AAN0SAG9_9VIBR|nr:23S rRNA (adenine(1618)-N(6))-methyltransferase RlmF [Vibrio coralliilyticus]AIW18709.1 23S rRNA methyltransferase [Vibrio coralliilyticus]NOH39992.1 23S rRNA (adenine(1618)-N(6))-methyltransferase RlmF [Vibrio coralliilyticus]